MRSTLAVICVFLAIYSASSNQNLTDPLMELLPKQQLQQLFEGQYNYWDITVTEELTKCFKRPIKTLNLIEKYFEKLNSISNPIQIIRFAMKDYVDSITLSKQEKECFVNAPENIELAKILNLEQFNAFFKRIKNLVTLVVKLPLLLKETTGVVEGMKQKDYKKAGCYISRASHVFYK